MRNISEITVCGKSVVVRELTVAQVEKQLSAMSVQEEPTTMDWMFAEDYMPQSTLEEIVSMPLSALMAEETLPSDIEPLYKEALKQNPFLAKALQQSRRIANLLEGMEGLMGQQIPVQTGG